MSEANKFIDGGNLDDLVDAERNREVLEYLRTQRPSCHSDTGDALLRATSEKCGEWQAFSPSFQQCLYVALVTNRRIFALGTGQRSVCFRLPPELYAIALQTGASSADEIAPEWVRFELFRADWPTPDLPFWSLQAYAAARQD
jgi:hypothetical protein